MTVGTRVSDNRHYVFCTSPNAYLLAGEYWQKTWSGGDRIDPEDMTPHNYEMNLVQTYNPFYEYKVKALPYDWWNGPYSYTVFDRDGLGDAVQLSWSDNDTLKLAIKLGNKIRGHSFNGAIFLAEANESLQLIGDTATRLAKFIDNIRQGKLERAARSIAQHGLAKKISRDLKNHFKRNSAHDDRARVAGAVLEVQYGWRPMLSEAASAGEAVAAILSRPPKSTFHATRKLQAENYYGGWKRRMTISQRLLATVSAPPTWRQSLRLGNYAQAITNKTALSFVANWFLPFEDYLEARNTFTDLNISRLLLTEKRTINAKFMRHPGNDIEVVSGNPYEAYHKTTYFKRSVLPIEQQGATSFAGSYLPMPSLKPIEKSLGWEHVLNGIALLNGAVRKVGN